MMIVKNLGIIGGCGSSGTTLLMHLLSRSKYIYSGPELNCFNHKELFDFDLLRSKYKKMLKGKAASSGYFGTHWFLTERQYYGFNIDLIEKWINSSDSTPVFVNHLCSYMLKRSTACYFVEKTPSNVYFFHKIISQLPQVPIIHIVRDGRDVVRSLMKRGYSLFGAGSRWLYDTICGLSVRDCKYYLEIKYEDLVTDPEKTLNKVFDHLKLPFDPEIIKDSPNNDSKATFKENWGNTAPVNQWNQKPTDTISTSSIGLYKKSLSPSNLSLLYSIHLRESVFPVDNFRKYSFGDLLKELNYDINDSRNAKYRLNLTKKWYHELDEYFKRLKFNWEIRYLQIPKRYTTII